MLRGVVVGVHAAAGILGLVAGVWAFAPPRADDRDRDQRRNQDRIRRLYLPCIAVLLVTLAVLIALDWVDLDAGARVAFLALAGLAAVMLYRLVLAGREARARAAGWQRRYVQHVYFTYVSLWIGFLVLPALNLPLPQVTVPLAAAAVLVIGSILVKRYKRSLPPE